MKKRRHFFGYNLSVAQTLILFGVHSVSIVRYPIWLNGSKNEGALYSFCQFFCFTAFQQKKKKKFYAQVFLEFVHSFLFV